MDPATIAFLVSLAASVAAYALTPGPPDAKAATLSDIDITTAEVGSPVPVIFGKVWCKGNVAYYGGLSTEKIKSKGKK